MKKRKHRLADLQMAIMQVLWSRGESTVAEVREGLLPGRELAHTTVSTMLTKMHRNGQVARKMTGRSLFYRAAIEQDRVGRSMAADLTARLCGGDVVQMVCHLFDGCQVSKDDLSRVKRLIRQKERELEDDRR